MSKKLILYVYFLLGCVAYGRLQAQTEAREELFMDDQAKRNDSTQRQLTENYDLSRDRLKSEDYIFTVEFAQYTELKHVIMESEKKLKSMIREISTRETKLDGLIESGILTEEEVLEKSEVLSLARVKCDELQKHLKEANVLLEQLKDRYQNN